MKKDRFRYSIIGVLLCAAVLSVSINVLNDRELEGEDMGSLSANAAGLSEVEFIRDPAASGPGVTEASGEVEDAKGESISSDEGKASADIESSASSESSPAISEAPTGADMVSEGPGAEASEEETEAASETEEASESSAQAAAYEDGELIAFSQDWEFASFAAISSGNAVYYQGKGERKGIVIAVNAGHGTSGGSSVKTYCHPDKTPKLTGGTTSAGATKAVAVSSGMNFKDGTPEHKVTLRMAQILKDKLVSEGYDVLMLRDGEDVQLDNVARTVMANNIADCHIALHWDSDGLSSDKGCFYMSVPDGLKSMYPVSGNWQRCEELGDALIEGLKGQGLKIWGSNPLDMDLTQTSYSTIASVDIELGNQSSSHTDADLELRAQGLLDGIDKYFVY